MMKTRKCYNRRTRYAWPVRRRRIVLRRKGASYPWPPIFRKELIVKPGHKVNLRQYDPGNTLGLEKGRAMKASLAKTLEKLDKLQYLLYADHKHALLVVFQALDAAGKDGDDPARDVRA